MRLPWLNSTKTPKSHQWTTVNDKATPKVFVGHFVFDVFPRICNLFIEQWPLRFCSLDTLGRANNLLFAICCQPRSGILIFGIHN